MAIQYLKVRPRGFPGGPVVNTHASTEVGMGLIPSPELKSHMLSGQKKKNEAKLAS